MHLFNSGSILLSTGLAQHIDLRFEDVHLIGFSLGAHVAGFAGSELKNISRITGRYKTYLEHVFFCFIRALLLMVNMQLAYSYEYNNIIATKYLIPNYV